MVTTNYNYLGDVPDNYAPQIGVQQGTPFRVDPYQGGKRNTGQVDQPILGRPRYTAESARGIYSLPKQEVWKWQVLLNQAGMLPTVDPGNAYQTYNAYKAAMAGANLSGVDLKTFLREQADFNKSGAGSGGSGGYGGSGGGGGGGGSSYTSTSTQSSSQQMTSSSINLTGRGTAESILRNALLQEIGRAPTDREVMDFKRALNRSERKNPSVTKSSSNTNTTTTTHVKGQDSSSSSSTTGSSTSVTKQSDVDPGEEALDYAKEKPLRRERNMYQDMQYYDAIAEMLGM